MRYEVRQNPLYGKLEKREAPFLIRDPLHPESKLSKKNLTALVALTRKHQTLELEIDPSTFQNRELFGRLKQALDRRSIHYSLRESSH